MMRKIDILDLLSYFIKNLPMLQLDGFQVWQEPRIFFLVKAARMSFFNGQVGSCIVITSSRSRVNEHSRRQKEVLLRNSRRMLNFQ